MFWHRHNTVVSDNKTPNSDVVEFSLKPPKNALTGMVTDVSGVVKIKKRDSDDFISIDRNSEIVDGDQIATEENSSAIISFTIGKITIGDNTQIECTNLIPEHFIIRHIIGKAEYVILENKPISVRFNDSLFSLETGKADISLDDSGLQIQMNRGIGLYARVDEKNITHVRKLNNRDSINVE